MAPPGAGQLIGRHLLCLGFGYSARWIAAEALEAGWHVAGTTRSAEKAERLSAEGIEAVVVTDDDVDGDLERLRAVLADATDVVVSIPPDRSAHGEDAGLRLLEAASPADHPGLRTVAYLSTTGVYGDHGGDWVHEDTEPRPGLERTRRRRATETAWDDWADARDLRMLTLRLSGIYGPGRSPIDRIRNGSARRIVKPGAVSNRIHVEDIGRGTVAALESTLSGAINFADDLPAASDEVMEYAAKLIGAPIPEAISWDDPRLSEMARSFFMEDRRVGNRRLTEELRIKLRHPTYREGLAALAGLSTDT